MLQPNILKVKPIDNYRLLLEYETGEKKIFDVKPYIKGSFYGKLSDKHYFNSVKTDGYTVEWKDGQDIAPHELYERSVDENTIIHFKEENNVYNQ